MRKTILKWRPGFWIQNDDICLQGGFINTEQHLAVALADKAIRKAIKESKNA